MDGPGINVLSISKNAPTQGCDCVSGAGDDEDVVIEVCERERKDNEGLMAILPASRCVDKDCPRFHNRGIECRSGGMADTHV